MNSTIDRLSDSGTAIVRQARRTLESTSSRMPDLPKWIEAGAALSVAKAGTRVATTLVRRNPGILLAVGVVGAGVLAYRAYRRHADARVDAPRAAISGKVTRSNGTKVKVTAADKKTGSTTKRAPRARKAAEQTEGADSSAE